MTIVHLMQKQGGVAKLDRNQCPDKILNSINDIKRDAGLMPHWLDKDCFTMDKMVKQIKFLGLKSPQVSCARISLHKKFITCTNFYIFIVANIIC